jgi:hypothetical protein
VSPFVPLLVLQEGWRHRSSAVRRPSVTGAMLGLMTGGDDEEPLHRQVRCANLYGGYQRLESPPDALRVLIESTQREWERTGRIPAWRGFDFLREPAFHITRADRHGGGYGLAPGGSTLAEWRAVVRAIADHPGASGEPIPPFRMRSTASATALAPTPRSHGSIRRFPLKVSRLPEPHIAPTASCPCVTLGCRSSPRGSDASGQRLRAAARSGGFPM